MFELALDTAATSLSRSWYQASHQGGAETSPPPSQMLASLLPCLLAATAGECFCCIGLYTRDKTYNSLSMNWFYVCII